MKFPILSIFLSLILLTETKEFQYMIQDCPVNLSKTIVNMTMDIERRECLDVNYKLMDFAPNIIMCTELTKDTLGLVTQRQNDPYSFIMLLDPRIEGILAENVVLHEFGHTLGLDHSCTQKSVMRDTSEDRFRLDFTFGDLVELRDYFPVRTEHCFRLMQIYKTMSIRQ
jgi:hypothetical protein